MSESGSYPLGYSAAEARRLEEQAALIGELTEDLFRRAGLSPGMRVLDVGCGVGDVSLLAAQMVGPEGSVLGIDRAHTSVETAWRRAATLRLANVRFEEANVTRFESTETFDAIVGRLVLLYLPDPAMILRRLARYVRPGGTIAFQEFDISQVSQTPPSELFTRTRRMILDAFLAGGSELDMGTKLYVTFLHAGLPPPFMIACSPVTRGPTSPGYEPMVQVLRSLLPLIERNGLANVADIGIDSLADRLREDADAHERVAYMPRVVGAWTRVAGGA